MRFRSWLLENVRSDKESIPDFLRLIFENRELLAQGYRHIKAKFGDHAGQMVYWHPNPAPGQPKVIPASSVTGGAVPSTAPPATAQPQQAAPPVAQQQQPVAGAATGGPPGMKEVPKPAGWVGPFAARFDDRQGRFKKGDPVYWNGKKGREGQNMPAFVPEDQEVPTPTIGGGMGGGQHNYRNNPSAEEVRLPPEKMTPYNQQIQDRFLETDDNIMIDALAGTGKTTMLKHLSSFMKPGEKWLYLVYNTKNRDESIQEFPVHRDERGNVLSKVSVMTTHGFLGDLLKSVDPSLGGGSRLPRDDQEDKIKILADRTTPKDWPETAFTMDGKSPFHGKAKFKAVRLAGLAKAYAFNPQEGDIAQKILQIVEDYNIDMDCSLSYKPKGMRPDAAQVVMNLPDEMIEAMKLDIIQKATEYLSATLPGAPLPAGAEKLGWLSKMRDQDDTLWFTAIFADQMNWQTPFDVVLMDEVQDFNMCQMIMAKKLKEAGHRVVAVGDPNQSMYRFRGADADAFESLKDVITDGGEAESLPINWRSGGNIIEWVRNNTHVKDLQAAPHLEGQGEVWAEGGTHPPVGYEDFMGLIRQEHQDGGGQLAHGTAMIARNNAPLAVAAIELLKSGIDFEIVGLDLSKELIKQIEEVVKDVKDENDNPLYVTWQQTRSGKSFPVADFASVPMEELMGNIIPDFTKQRTAMWHASSSKQDKLKRMRNTMSILGYIWNHVQDEYSMDEEAKAIRGGSVQDLVTYIKNKLGGKDPDSKEDMDKIKQKDPKSYVTLTTAHKSKGLEWDRVFLAAPGAYNPEGEKIRTEEDAQQELNAWYVAATRGRNVLMVSADEEPMAGGGEEAEGEMAQQVDHMIKMMRGY